MIIQSKIFTKTNFQRTSHYAIHETPEHH